MQLTYRGAHYEYTPHRAETVRETNVFRAIRPTFNLLYRGSVYAVDPNEEPSLTVSSNSTAQLLYRGAAYTLNGWTKPAARSMSNVASSKPRFNSQAARSGEFASVHRTNLHTNLQRRLQVARDKGDQNLVNLLERELQQIV